MSEKGEPHNKMYTIRCKLSGSILEPLIAEGTGSSKKLAKQNACIKILNDLKNTGEILIFLKHFFRKRSSSNCFITFKK